MPSGESNSIHSDRPHCQEGDLLRRKLKFFFMNPCEKWRAKRRFPWKMVLQLVKIFFVTAQLALFGFDRGGHVDFLEKSNIAFKHLFLEGWQPSFETMPYPPATGAFAVYTIPEFFSSVNYALRQYNLTEKVAIGTYHFSNPNATKPPVVMCNTFYKIGKISAHNQSFLFDDTKIEDCFQLLPVIEYDESTQSAVAIYDVEKFLLLRNKSINFDSIISVELKFSVKTVHLRKLSKVHTPDCFRFNISIFYDNSLHNGQMTVALSCSQEMLKCNGKVTSDVDEGPLLTLVTIFDAIVILVSSVSLFLCCRSLHRGNQLRKETSVFFEERLNHPLQVHSHFEFVNFWYIMIVINDLMTIVGSGLKIRIENKESAAYEACGVLLGTANLLVWFGVLRYLGFFEKYNILILTMKKSAPNILRFLVCAGVFYFGFTVCGWVVLGPYHLKFRTLSVASECLFALVNGDELYVTFATIPNTGSYVWWYSRVFLYVFISFFIYVVLSVFISVIMDTYETIKSYYEHGFPKTELQQFYDQITDEAHELFTQHPKQSRGSCCLCGCIPACIASCRNCASSRDSME
ncbi:hypothetical protein CAPTEDRAFT_136028 [Capitella teleta]|uniref:Uncharacterized protein n=1 Tax=Capitella teleta TaxID=283909 RepID=R7UMX7_CAPTE|nr:hypothetical protein CAPTEDRAFT_136028 [Capitella teleta]|eukprot:ELU05297.1 hypothetical protein CAPTEDRAFT_136028 [Capitella teleta]